MSLPTIEEIATLPRWAVVAFAAKSARRAVNAMDAHHHHKKERKHLLAAVHAVEEFASKGSAGYLEASKNVDAAYPLYQDSLRETRHASKAERMERIAKEMKSKDMEEAIQKRTEHSAEDCLKCGYAPEAVWAAAAVALYAVSPPEDVGNEAVKTAFRAAKAASEASDPILVRSDFDKLAKKALEGNWDDDTPVEPLNS